MRGAAAAADQEVSTVSLLVLVILAVFATLIVAGPVLEDLIDRIFPRR